MCSIRNKISVATIGAILITMIFATIFGVTAIRIIGADSSKQMLYLLCEVGQKNLDTCFLNVEQEVQAISTYVESDLDGLDDRKLEDHLDRISDFFRKSLYKENGIRTYYYRIDPSVSSQVEGFWFVYTEEEGFQEHEVTDITKYDTEDTSALVWFTVPKATGKAVWLSPYITETLNERVISYNMPIYYKNQFVGIVGIELDYSYMASLVNNITLYEHGYAYVDDEEGHLIFHPYQDPDNIDDAPLPEGRKDEDRFSYYTYEGVEKVAVGLPLCNGNRLNVSVPLREINAAWQRWVSRIILVFIALLVAFIVFISRFTRNITKPLVDLTKVAEQIDEGNYDYTLDYNGRDEIGTLTRTFSRVTDNLKHYIKNLNDVTRQLTLQKESMSALLDNMPALNYSKDPESGAYLYCNQGFAEFAHKQSPGETVGLTDAEIFNPDMAQHFTKDDQKALSMDKPYVFYEDVVDAVGNRRQLRTTKMKFYNSSGALCLLGMCLDVTELERIRKEIDETRAAYQEALNTNAIYQSVVSALSGDYFDLYYVDVMSGNYIEYGSWTEEGKRGTEKHGQDFFAETTRNADDYIYEEDRERFKSVINKDNLLKKIQKHGAFIYHYRLLIGGNPTYVSMKVTSNANDSRHIIIGISNVDTQVKDRKAAERAEEERKSYMRLNALNRNLIFLYFVDPENDAYTEFSSSAEYKELGIARQGSDFFKSTYQNSFRTIHPEDLALFHTQFTKANILETIKRDGAFVLDYRLMSEGLPTYVRTKAAIVEENGKQMLIVGMQDEDLQIRQEKEYARKLLVAKTMATIDSLTGVKNKHAYSQWEEKINTAIEKGEQEPFAVVVCDVNNLKAVNDLFGHKEGDVCIKNACRKICVTFSHSPVFRIGGDEFVVLLTGEDYKNRKKLMEEINLLPKNRSKIRIGETLSAGMAEYEKYRHYSLLSVFEEADKAMYERKQYLKSTVLSPSNAQNGTTASGKPSDPVHADKRRKKLLIVDDMESNREILGEVLKEEYDIMYASDGDEALTLLQNQKKDVDLMLLDLVMPKMNGREVLARMQVDDDLRYIPVIVLTVDQEAELDCLKIGAMDFIPKPYPDIKVVKARIDRCLELFEDCDSIRSTECDHLTGLLTREFFFKYVHRLDQIYQDRAMDALVLDVNRFHAINKLCGRQFGDHFLCNMGAGIKKLAEKTGGIGCRQGKDVFLLYCPHQEKYDDLLNAFTTEVVGAQEGAEEISLRIGIYANAHLEADAEERFARARSAADRVKEEPVLYGYYEPV